MDLSFIFLLIALIFFVLSAIGVGARFNLQSAGLACVVLAMLTGSLAFP